jgi:DNA (cytosine-5)-methyltransferase 1
MTLEEWDESRRSQKERGVGSFGPRGDSLGAAILRVEEGTERPDYSTTKARRGGDEPGVTLLPTPRTRDGKGGTPSRAGDNKHDLPSALLPTPRSSDCFGAGQHGDGGMDLPTTVTLFRTPNASDAQGQNGRPSRASHQPSVGDQVVNLLLPTPAAQDGNGGGRYSSEGHQTTLPGEARLLCTPSAWGKYEPAIRRWEQIVGPAPAPTEPNKNGNPRLSAAFSEWLMGWPAGWVTDPAIGISRNDQLRIVGNGVCTQQAIAALRYLLAVTA